MTNTDVVLCPICNAPFNPRGLQRHITVKHGKDAANSSPNAPSNQSEPSSPIPAIPEPLPGDEVLRANQDPMNDPATFDTELAKDIEDCDENSKWSKVVTGDGVEVDDTAYTELDAPGPVMDKIDQAIEELYAEKAKESSVPAPAPSDDHKDLAESAWIVGAAVEKSATACESMEKSAPIPTSPQKVLSQIPINSEILLQGEVYWQNPTTFDWELATADKLQVVVVGLETVDNVVHLMCKVNGGQALWSVLQSDVLEGKYRVIKLANSVPTTSPIPPPNGKREFVESSEDLYKKALAEFLPIFNEYLEYKERLEVAESQFASRHETYYQTIENFVLQYGETVEDEGDTPYCLLEVDGVRMRLVAGDGLIFEKIEEVENA